MVIIAVFQRCYSGNCAPCRDRCLSPLCSQEMWTSPREPRPQSSWALERETPPPPWWWRWCWQWEGDSGGDDDIHLGHPVCHQAPCKPTPLMWVLGSLSRVSNAPTEVYCQRKSIKQIVKQRSENMRHGPEHIFGKLWTIVHRYSTKNQIKQNVERTLRGYCENCKKMLIWPKHQYIWPNVFGHIQGRDFLTILFHTFFILLLLFLQRIQPLAIDHPEGPASCKCSSGGAGLLQMLIRRIRPLANDHPEGPPICKWSFGGSGLLQMIIWRDQPLANDHPSPPLPLSPLPGSSMNLADLSRTIFFCFLLFTVWSWMKEHLFHNIFIGPRSDHSLPMSLTH